MPVDPGDSRQPKWYEQDEFWRVTYPDMFSAERWASAPTEVTEFLELIRLAPPASVLDVSCGPGRHVIELDRLGFVVTGVDPSAFLLEKARVRAQNEGATVELIHADVRSFRRTASFDAAISMYSSFGYFEDPADDRLVVENVFQSLRKGGRVLVDVVGREVLQRIFSRHSHREGNGVVMDIERRVNGEFSWIENYQTIVSDEQTYTFNMQHRIYSADELLGLLQGVGFEHLHAYGSLSGAPYDSAAARLIAIGQKS